ncbi:hypothetical protein [Tsukamurella sp. 1534]|uniref:hypothetical protein n=1 Tax=Tsukamurella sp. 1534 TaxID=1151061 RepID=UPI0003159103|nr:hypothetical protein [Tsukamurella sp. 1534]
MSGTKIDAAAVARAGGVYTTEADDLTGAASRIRGYTAEPGDFGRKYQAKGEAYGASLRLLSDAVDAWRNGARAVGTGLTNSASAHKSTDTGAASAVTGAGNGG